MAKELNVAVTVRIMPKDVETDLEVILEQAKKDTKSIAQLHSSEIKPVAFGLKSLTIAFLMSDDEGGVGELEEALGKIEGVSEVDVIEVTRL